MSTIVISEFMEEDAVREILRGYDVRYDPSLCDKPAELAAALKDVRALIVRNRTQVRADLLAAAAKLECIGRLGVGLDNIDVAACKARGIAVYPAIGANEVSVAEYVVGAIIVLMRGVVPRHTRGRSSGKWPRTTLVGREICRQAARSCRLRRQCARNGGARGRARDEGGRIRSARAGRASAWQAVTRCGLDELRWPGATWCRYMRR